MRIRKTYLNVKLLNKFQEHVINLSRVLSLRCWDINLKLQEMIGSSMIN